MARDYRERYALPRHWILDPVSRFGTEFFSYMSIIMRLLPPAPARVLDAGGGDGWLAARLQERGYQLTVVDIAEAAIAFGRIFVPEANFQVGDLTTLDADMLPGYPFDILLSTEVLEHIPAKHHPQIMARFHRALKPGGHLVLSVPSDNRPLNKYDHQHFDAPEVRQLLDDAGFEIQELVLQHRLDVWGRLIFHRWLWKALGNRYYDFRIFRRALSGLYKLTCQSAAKPETAGRYIFSATRL